MPTVMSVEKKSNKLVYVGAGLAAVGLGAAIVYLMCAPKHSVSAGAAATDDDAFTGSKGSGRKAASAGASTMPKSMDSKPAAAKPASSAEAAAAVKAAVAAAGGAVPAPPPGQYPALGIHMELLHGWQAQEEIAPVPNVAMIALQKPEFTAGPSDVPGKTPVVLISAEDISAEGLDTKEFVEKTKMMAIRQMMMMTQGMFQPEISFEGEKAIGPFTHMLEYSQNTPFFQMKVLNLMTVKEGIAYIFQLMVNPSLFETIAPEIKAIAATMSISPPAVDAEASYTAVTGRGASCRVPAGWGVEKTAAENPVLEFKTPSVMKPDAVSVYDDAKDKAWAKPAKWSEFAEKAAEGGAVVKKFKDGLNRTHIVVSGNGATVVVTPKSRPTPLVSDEQAVRLWSTVEMHDAEASAAEGQRYVSFKLGFSMATVRGSRIMESRLGERTVVYAPMGIPDGSGGGEDGPLMTIRVGDPSNDEDCRATLEEWEERVQQDAGGVTGLKRDTVNGVACLTFVNKESQEVGPGVREERIAKVFILLKGIVTTMLRWEAPAPVFRQNEAKLAEFLAAFELL